MSETSLTKETLLTKEKRALSSNQRKRDHRNAAASLAALQREGPSSLWDDFQDHINYHMRQAERTRDSDRQDVLNALWQWAEDGLFMEDIVDETELSTWAVRDVIDDLLELGAIEARERIMTGRRGRRPLVYFPLLRSVS